MPKCIQKPVAGEFEYCHSFDGLVWVEGKPYSRSNFERWFTPIPDNEPEPTITLESLTERCNSLEARIATLEN